MIFRQVQLSRPENFQSVTTGLDGELETDTRQARRKRRQQLRGDEVLEFLDDGDAEISKLFQPCVCCLANTQSDKVKAIGDTLLERNASWSQSDRRRA